MNAPERSKIETPLGVTDVSIGHGTPTWPVSPLASALEVIPASARIGLVMDENVAGAWPDPKFGEREVLHRVIVPPGEKAKTREVLAKLQDQFLDLRHTDLLVAVGGGAVLDVAGFAAATIRRGIPWAAVATSVVAMADAAIGGKVAINHANGKNLLGTFHPPRIVSCDVAYLDTLPERDSIAGLAEIYKSGLVGMGLPRSSRNQRKIFQDLLKPSEGAWSAERWIRLISASALLKGIVVAKDERDVGPRRLLNFGHTVGHALESVLGNDDMRHGEGVAIGMLVAAELTAGRGWIQPNVPKDMAGHLQSLGLPVVVPKAASTGDLIKAIAQDKKRGPGDDHTLVLLGKTPGLVIARDVTDKELRKAIDATR